MILNSEDNRLNSGVTGETDMEKQKEMWKIKITDQGPPKVLIVNSLSNFLVYMKILETNMNLYCAT